MQCLPDKITLAIIRESIVLAIINMVIVKYKSAACVSSIVIAPDAPSFTLMMSMKNTDVGEISPAENQNGPISSLTISMHGKLCA